MGSEMCSHEGCKSLCAMKCRLMEVADDCTRNINYGTDIHELGEIIDMIKDIYQLEYYCAKTKYYESVTEAMDEYGDADHFKMGRSGMMRVLPEYDRRDQRFDPDEYDIYGRMGYSGRVPHSNMGRNWDRYLDARRHYNATKSDSDRMEMSTSAKMHIGETIATLRDMWHDADPDLREKMKKDFSALLQEMN